MVLGNHKNLLKVIGKNYSEVLYYKMHLKDKEVSKYKYKRLKIWY